MSEPVEAARDLLRSTRPPVEEWRIKREIREHSGSEVDMPKRQEVLLENLDDLTGSDEVLEENVEEVIDLVLQWPDEKLEEIRNRVRELAKPVVKGGEGSEEGV